GLIIELANGTTVTALYVISKNLQLWFGVYRRFFADKQIVVLLEGIGFLRIETNENLTVEHGRGSILCNVLIPFVTFAVRLHVVHDGMVVYQLAICRKGDTV